MLVTFQIYSVLADEAAERGNVEQMPIVIRNVDSDKEINERFVRFVDFRERMTGLALSQNIEETLKDVGLPESSKLSRSRLQWSQFHV